MPLCRAMLRLLQCVAASGWFSSVWTITLSPPFRLLSIYYTNFWLRTLARQMQVPPCPRSAYGASTVSKV
jgi:hypothetical protein